eukprot:XP_020406558.1 zinc finger BED domain-containing protein DAYSLEEPER-like [Zea mays]
MDDDDDNDRYPRTINDELVELGQLPDDVDDMGDAAAALFSVGSSHGAGDLEGTTTGPVAVSDAAGSNELDSLTSSSTGKCRSAVWDDFTEVTENRNGKKVHITDNASSNSTAMLTLSPMLAGYLGADVDPTDPTEKVLEFLELFYESTVVLSGVYYPTSPLVIHHILEFASHLHEHEHDTNLSAVAVLMKAKFMNTYFANVKTELYKLYGKYETKFGAARPSRTTHQSGSSGSSGPGAGLYEITIYLDSDNVAAYEDDFDILNWWHEHKLTYPILSIMARDIMSVLASTTSSESTISLSGRILEDRRQRLNAETVEMLVCIKDWELGQQQAQHVVVDNELEESFKELWLDEEGLQGAGAAA